MPILTPEERIGTRLANRYRLDRILGRGGMGVVFAGVHTWTGRDVAVKLMLPSAQTSKSALERFFREARTAGEMRHPNVVDVLDMGVENDGSVYLVLELLEGESLGQHLRRKKTIAPDEAVAILVPILRALAALHERGVVHRDLKPDNIFLGVDGVGTMVPKLLDFGISKRLELDEGLTGDGALIGTPHYMSPEQVRGPQFVTTKSDIWSMGVVLFECLSGKLPFPSESITGVLTAIASQAPRELVELRSDLPAGMLETVSTALSRKPEERFADARTFADALDDVAQGERWDMDTMRTSWPRMSIPAPVLASPPSADDMFDATHELTTDPDPGNSQRVARLEQESSTEPDVPPNTPETGPSLTHGSIHLPASNASKIAIGVVALAAAIGVAVVLVSGGGDAPTSVPADPPVTAAQEPPPETDAEPIAEAPTTEEVPAEATPELPPTTPEPVAVTPEERPMTTRRRRARPDTNPTPEGANHAPIIVD